jgi:hypothetical protein
MVIAPFVGAQLFGSPWGGLGGADADPTATPEASSADPSSPDALLPEGPFAWFEAADPPEPPSDGPPITVTIPASGWMCPYGIFSSCILAQGDAIDTIRDQTAVAQSRQTPLESALITMSTTAGILVYEDPCQWEYNVPHPPATTADDIAAALAAQPSRDASDPVDVTIGGYPGKMITLQVPDDAVLADCFRGVYASYTLEGYDSPGGVPWRWHQGPGQIDTFWIVEVDGAIVIINAMYRADTPAERIEEMTAIAESASFE